MRFQKTALAGLALAAGITLVASPAFAAPTHSFKIGLATTDDSAAVDVESYINDDGGYLAVTPDVLLLTGNNGSPVTASFNFTTLAEIAAPLSITTGNLLYSDLATETAYSVAYNGNDYPYQATALDADGNETSTVIDFSEPIPADDATVWMAASGYGELGFWDTESGDVYIVALPSGNVTHLTGLAVASDFADYPAKYPADNQENTYNIGQQGVLEVDCSGNYSFDLMQYNDTSNGDESFVRYSLATKQSETILAAGVGDDTDIDTFIVSPTASRWYVHSESPTSVFGIPASFPEALVSGDALLETNACSPSLPDTGVSAEQAGLIGTGAVVLALAGVAIVVIRRRMATK